MSVLTTYPEEDRRALIGGRRHTFRGQLDKMSIYQITEVSLPWGPGTFPAFGF